MASQDVAVNAQGGHVDSQGGVTNRAEPASNAISPTSDDWAAKGNETIAKKKRNKFNDTSEASQWNVKLWDCFSPASLCLTACFCPCITFGKTYHRMNRYDNMEGYKCCNTSCSVWCLATQFPMMPLQWVLTALQLHEIREKYHIKGSYNKDILKACFCQPCSLVQIEKETKMRVLGRPVVHQQYQNETMSIPQTREQPGSTEPKTAQKEQPGEQEPKAAQDEGTVAGSAPPPKQG